MNMMTYEEGELATMAAAYALTSVGGRHKEAIELILDWLEWGIKPKNAIQDLVRTGALILAEIERLQRQSLQSA